MALDWIKLACDVFEKPEVHAIADATRSRTVEEVIGRLAKVWMFAERQSKDGVIHRMTAAMVDRIAGKKGFAAAMAAVGWLTLTADGGEVPNYDRHMGGLARTRALDADRKQAARAAGGRAEDAPRPDPVRALSGPCPGLVRVLSGLRPGLVRTGTGRKRD